MNSRTRAVTSFASLALALGLAACASDPQPPTVTQVVGGYELDAKYASALDYSGNDAIFTVRITGSRQAELSAPISTEADDKYVYTPVEAVVTDVLKAGSSKLAPGAKVVLRVLGGATDERITTSEISAGAADYKPGSQIQIFAQPAYYDKASGEVQYVPNWAFSIEAGTVRNLHEREVTLTVGEADLQAQEAAAWRGWQK